MPIRNASPLALLIFPPVYDFAFYDLFVKPYSLLVIGKAFENAGYRVKLINCLDYADRESIRISGAPRRYANGTGKMFRQIVSKPSVLKDIPRHFSRYGITEDAVSFKLAEDKPDIVILSTGMTYWYPGVAEITRLSKRLYPDVPVVAGGVYASLMPEHCKNTTGADHVVASNTYGSLSEICAQRKLPSPLPGCCDIMLHESFRDAAVIRINKGCPFRCDYCASKAVSGAFEEGDPVASLEIVKKIHSTLGTVNFAFYDDALLACKERVFLPFLESLIRSGLDLRFYLPNGIHLAYLDLDTASLMKRAGFKEIRMGFESSAAYFHRTHDTKLEAESLSEKIALLEEAGFDAKELGVYILAGLPGQGMEEVRDTITYVRRYGIRPRISEYSPVPGSPLWKESVRLSRFPIEEEPLCHNNTILPMQWEGFTLEDLDDLKKYACEG